MNKTMTTLRLCMMLVAAEGFHLQVSQHNGARFHQTPPTSSAIRQSQSDFDFGSSTLTTQLQNSFVPSSRMEDDLTGPRQSSTLSAVAIGKSFDFGDDEDLTLQIDFLGSVKPLVTTALLITGNTVGAGTLVLPSVAQGPGFAPTVGMFAAAYVINLVSGLVLAEIAIKEKEAYGEDVPSSFKEFAEMSLESPSAANAIAGISLFVNTCILSFDLSRAGVISADLVGGAMSPVAMTAGFSTILSVLGASQSSEKLSEVASCMVSVLFVSFAGLLLPGLTNVHDPLGTLVAPGTSEALVPSMIHAAPIILTTLVFQNIVPSVTKILNYDRTKTTISVALGSLMPLLIYVAWCLAVLGGGVSIQVGASSPLMTMFSMAAVFGSSLGCTMSISEELDTFQQGSDDLRLDETDDAYSWQSVMLGMAVSTAGAIHLLGGADGSEALKIAGSYGTPLLYGMIPIGMAWKQRAKLNEQENLVPGGFGSLGILGVAFGSFMLNELVRDVSALIS